jgi:hypothetical protein
MLRVSSSAIPSKPSTGFHISRLSGFIAFQYVTVDFAIACLYRSMFDDPLLFDPQARGNDTPSSASGRFLIASMGLALQTYGP